MADRQECLAPQEAVYVFMRVNVGDVGDIVSVVFEPANHPKFPRAGPTGGQRHLCSRVPEAAKIVSEEVSCAHTVNRGRLRTASIGAVGWNLWLLCAPA